MKKYVLSLLISLLIATISFAQEGMWLLNQIDDLNLKEKGLQIETSDIYNPEKPSLYNAILQLGGGSASFVSSEGLIITNHHVAFGALQRASSAESDYLTNGFLARNRSDEIQAPGYEARLLLEMKDVTDEVLKATKNLTDPTKKDRAINEKMAKMTEAIEKKKGDVDVRIAEMYNGKQYIQFVYKVFKDIRIVYAPPGSIGKYGGDIDNWMWPRHTGDFSFLRVYVSPDGDGAEYSTDNVPYKPIVWLKVATDDLKNKDLTFIMGYPGATTRYRTSNSAAWNLNYNYPFSVKNFSEIINIMDDLTENDPEGKIKVAGLRAGLANAQKNFQGKVDGMTNTNYVQKKLDFEEEFMDWVNSDPETKAKYGNVLKDIKAQYAIINKTRERDDVLGLLQGLSGTQLGIADMAYGIAMEMEKPKNERRPGYDEDAVQQTIDALQYQYMGYFEPVDKAMMIRALKMVNELPAGQRIEGLEYIFDDPSITIEDFVENAYNTSKLNDLEFSKSLFVMSPDEIVALNDPFIEIAVNIYPLTEKNREVYESFAANVTELRKQYIDALYEWQGSNMYPDANSTMRFTAGPVKGYSPTDAVWYKPFTTLNGVVQKNTGIEPFDAPAKLLELAYEKDYGNWVDPELNDVPVAFLHQCDITGGNSGSPVMNAKGELIGVAFDGNYEAMISDWQYDYELQRTISVDIRYVMFITEKFANAGFILDEMGVAR
ncbi:MAG: hypothetical protein C0591_08920 [Marinilabiliales bacterium]|nr:MAG: hypothetical protein C0591_08920 [Marinilabiliales bacterium]